MINRNRWANRKGFTLAELMLAVAIIIILGALAFVGVANYLRGLRLLEMDNAAKEIFYAAQNRITAELNSGTLGRLNESEISTDKTAAGTRQMKDSKGNAVEYAVVYPDATPNKEALKTTLWDELLPFGSIDDTLRSGGSYIITYSYDKEANLATILDVWFTSNEGSGFFRNWSGSEDLLRTADYDEHLYNTRGDEGKDNRRNFRGDAVIGHYGRDPVTIGNIYNFTNLSFKLVNDEVLYGDFTFNVEQRETLLTTDNILDKLEPQIKVTITGKNATNIKVYDIKSLTNSGVVLRLADPDTNTLSYRFILDNIAANGQRFRDLIATGTTTGTFILGEDINVNIEVYSNKELANIDSASAVDNSLFQYVKTDTDSGMAEAGIGKIRHLQNLSSEVSGAELGAKDASHDDRLGINSALQTADLDWMRFTGFKLIETDETTKIGGNIYYNDTNTNNSFYPIDVTTTLVYDAGYKDASNNTKNHKISNLKVNDDNVSDAGLFGMVGGTEVLTSNEYQLTVRNLDMENPVISGTKNAGALIGKVTVPLRVENVEIREPEISAPENAGGLVGTSDPDKIHGVHFILDLVSVYTENKTVEAASGSAGGLVGHIGPSTPTITNSYSTALVSGDIAGGLIGSIKNSYKSGTDMGSIRGCYVGGHVEDVPNPTTTKIEPVYSSSAFNVTGISVAGGFIGTIDAGSGSGLSVQASYSTASTTGNTAAGFIGKATGEDFSNTNISYCYAVGLVKDAKTDDNDGTPSGAFAGDIAAGLTLFGNRYFELINGEMSAVGSNPGPIPTQIKSAETDLNTYNAFFVNDSNKEMEAFSNALKGMFGETYFLPTAQTLAKELDPSDTKITLNKHVGDWQPVDTLVYNTTN